MSDEIDHPRHYTYLGGVECIDVVENMNFNRGNAIKYIWRAGVKGEANAEIQDLQKARWYIDREIQRLQGHQKNGQEVPRPERPKREPRYFSPDDNV